jgi:phosphate starvation-inducible protein PhoH and related proteins
VELTISLPDGNECVAIVGAAERNLKMIRETLGINITARNGSLKLSGSSGAVGRAASVIKDLTGAAKQGNPLKRERVLELISTSAHTPRYNPEIPGQSDFSKGFDVYGRGKRIAAMTEGQKHYIDAMAKHDLTFCIGPAGTGKTYLAVAAAAHMLKQGSIRKLILVRPAVEAGEKLGFLPGDLQAKVNPYLRPLLDALHGMMDFDQIQRFMACDLIEIVPLAFMRGRTLNDSLIILDEAQNTTKAQMMMFLTRLGHGGKMIVTGDTSQIDLPDKRDSGLIDAVRRLRHVNGVAMTTLDGSDIVRHNLVQRIVEAYGETNKQQDPELEQILKQE